MKAAPVAKLVIIDRVSKADSPKVSTPVAPLSVDTHLLGTLAFYISCWFVHVVAIWIPDVRLTGLDQWVNLHALYDRGDVYNSDWISTSNLFTYTLMNFVGFMYVAAVNVGRKNWLVSQNYNVWDLSCTLFCISPFVFFSSLQVNLRSRHANDANVCGADEADCQTYDDWQVFWYNYFVWTPCFFLGMQFTIIQNYALPALSELSFTSESLKKQSAAGWLVVSGILLLILGVLGVFIIFYIREKMLQFILFLTLGWLLFFVWGTVINYKGRTIHVHHWTMGLMFTTYMSHPHWVFTIMHGIANGLMIEGGARWGWDPVWKKKINEFYPAGEYPFRVIIEYLVNENTDENEPDTEIVAEVLVDDSEFESFDDWY